MGEQQTSMEREVSVKLTVAEVAERGETLAAKMLHVEHLRTKKREDAKSIQALIDTELDECSRLARVISDQEELRKQGELFVDDEGATRALAKIAAEGGAVTVGESPCCCDPETPGVYDLDCPIHGVDGEGEPEEEETDEDEEQPPTEAA